jgi:hypothetical protein
MAVRGGRGYSARPHPFQASGQMFKDDVNDLSPWIFASCARYINWKQSYRKEPVF